jgi:putative selenate reductase
MALLRPYPFSALARRAFRELEQRRAIFDLPLDKGFFGEPGLDLAVRHHGFAASSPFGPAAGPHSQLAQNIVLAWLAGGRIVEWKTVQVNDTLTIPRPCIDVQTVGYNVEWSQELALDESREEYVKAAMLIEMLVASGRLPLVAGFERVLYDLSVGYDLAGISGERVAGFISGLRDATATVERLRREIPPELGALRDLPFATALSSTLTLSTFHGCPPDEIERIVRHLQERHRLHCIVKLNPVLLGPQETHRLLHDALGYHEIRVPEGAFARDTSWTQMADFVGRLGESAAAAGLSFGVKFSNTLIVENHRDFFPASEREMYLSGPPLHVLASALVARFRAEFGDRFPISFAAGIDRGNFAEVVALGLAPVTVCTDLLRPGGFARGRGYLSALAGKLRGAGARNVDEWVIRAFGHGAAALERAAGASDPAALERCRAALDGGGDLRAAAGDALFARWVSEARLANSAHYAARTAADARYAAASNRALPKKIGRHLKLFDCINCEKCVPVCPNDANFVFALAPCALPIVRVSREDGGWRARTEGTLAIADSKQIGNFADFCNDCGNCDVFCPEDGGPYVIKPRFFATQAAWEGDRPRDGFHLQRSGDGFVARARLAGREYQLELTDGRAVYAGDGFRLRFEESDPLATLAGEAVGEVDLTYFRLMALVARALLAPSTVNYVNCL